MNDKSQAIKLPYQTINQFADQFQQRFSQFQSIAAIMDLVNKPLTVDPQYVWNQQVVKVEDVSDVISSCSCAIHLRRSKSTSRVRTGTHLHKSTQPISRESFLLTPNFDDIIQNINVPIQDTPH